MISLSILWLYSVKFLVLEEGKEVVSTVKFSPQSSFTRQLVALTYREIVSNIRDTGALFGRFGLTIMLNVLFGN